MSKRLNQVKLNEALIRKQNLTWAEVEEIKKLHGLKNDIIKLMRNTVNDEVLLALSDVITSIEYNLQDNWHFPRNNSFHKFWNLPHCTCPKIDNDDRYPSGFYVYNRQCLLHKNRRNLS